MLLHSISQFVKYIYLTTIRHLQLIISCGILKLYNSHRLQISKCSVDESSKNVEAVIPSCRLAIDWKGPHKVEMPVFKRRVNLRGAKSPKDHFTLHIRPSPPSPSPTPSTNRTTSAASQWYTCNVIQMHTPLVNNCALLDDMHDHGSCYQVQKLGFCVIHVCAVLQIVCMGLSS